MKATYIWYLDKLVVIEREIFSADFSVSHLFHKYRYCPTVLPYRNLTALRYGTFVCNDKTSTWATTWQPLSFESFPEEFKTHLLLLGVS